MNTNLIEMGVLQKPLKAKAGNYPAYAGTNGILQPCEQALTLYKQAAAQLPVSSQVQLEPLLVLQQLLLAAVAELLLLLLPVAGNTQVYRFLRRQRPVQMPEKHTNHQSSLPVKKLLFSFL